jgi:hypothetical protein
MAFKNGEPSALTHDLAQGSGGARAMKARTSRQGDSIMNRGHSTRFGGTPPRPDDIPGTTAVRARRMAWQDRGDPLIVDVWRRVAVVAAGWLVLLAMALLALSTVPLQPSPPPPVTPVRSEFIVPGFNGIQPEKPGLGAETTQ